MKRINITLISVFLIILLQNMAGNIQAQNRGY